MISEFWNKRNVDAPFSIYSTALSKFIHENTAMTTFEVVKRGIFCPSYIYYIYYTYYC